MEKFIKLFDGNLQVNIQYKYAEELNLRKRLKELLFDNRIFINPFNKIS